MPKFALFLRRPGGSQPGQTSAAPSLINIRNVRIASPCTAKWEEMKGSDWMRHCTQCNLNVYNFSAMTWKEVEKLIAGHQGRLCARFYRRADGTMLTQDCPKGLRAVVRRVSRWAGAVLSAVAVVNFAGAQSAYGNPLVQIKGAEPRTESAGQEAATVVALVTDPLGAVVTGATVRLDHQVLSKSWEGTTGQDGLARLPELRLGQYTLTVSARGVEIYQRTLKLSVAQIADLNIQLQVAAVMIGLRPDEYVQQTTLIPTEIAPFQSNLQPVPETPAKKQHKGWLRRHGSGAKSSAGLADPPAVPRTGQPHAVLHLQVTDPQGATIPGARVQLREREGSRQWGGVTDAHGSFSMRFCRWETTLLLFSHRAWLPMKP